MRQITTAVFLEQQLQSGGGYQQALNATLLANKLPQDLCSVLYVTTIHSNIAVLKKYGIEAIFMPMPKWRRLCLKLRRLIRYPSALGVVRYIFGRNSVERFFAQYDVDLVYFTGPSVWAQELERLNYIMTVWDLCHRDDPEFPEVRDDRKFENRDDLYSTTLTKAIAVLIDSEVGKKNVIRRYAVDESRTHILPFSPADGTQISDTEYTNNFIDIKKKYELTTEYVFYPAQFWAHKNHIYILQAIKYLEDNFGYCIGAIFSGSDAGGNLNYIKNTAQKLGLLERIRFAGFVPNDEIPYLYRQSIALVMPTYFGPTNLPPLEAFSLGVPVLYSDKHGLREQVGEAALLLDLYEPSSLAIYLNKLITDDSFRKSLIMNGRQYLESLNNSEDDLLILASIIKDFAVRRECWE